MKMILKIVIWGLLFYGTVSLDRGFLLPRHILLPDLVFLAWFFGVYLALLYWEIRSRIKKSATQKQLRWAGFNFTFGVGFLWATSFLALGKTPWLSDPFIFFSLLASFIITGIMIGIVGMAITQFTVLFVFKQPEQV